MKKFPRTTSVFTVSRLISPMTAGILGILLAGNVLFVHCAKISAQELSAEPGKPASEPAVTASLTDRYIALRNGSIMHGDIKLIGDRYEITNATGSVVLPQVNVVQIAENLQQIYTYRASNVFASDVEGRCELIRWCFQYDLIPEAELQVELLRKYAPEHPLMEVFERRLKYLEEEKKKNSAAAVKTEGTQPPESVSEGENTVLSADVHRPVGPSIVELNRMADTLPEDSIEIFRKRIQPVLQKNCMTFGCHGPDSQEQFRLLRISPTMARGELLQNMYAALQQINLSHPESSPFLRKPVSPHGKDGRVVFVNSDYGTYQLLIGWTYLVAQNRYVIPRDRLVPTSRGVPAYTPTARGLQRVSSSSSAYGAGPCPMSGVDASLYPQALYPQEYAQRPAVTVPQTPGIPNAQNVPGVPNSRTAGAPQKFPPMKLVLPAVHDTETPENPDENEVIPASGEQNPDASPADVVPVSAEEPETNAEEPETNAGKPEMDAGKPETNAEMNFEQNSSGGYEGEEENVGNSYVPVPEEGTELLNIPSLPENAADSGAGERMRNIPETAADSGPEAQTQDLPWAEETPAAAPTFYAPGQHTIEGRIYAPGQNSIDGRIYAPGESSADNLHRGNPNVGVAASPARISRPQSPASLMYGRDSVERDGASGAYLYGNSGNASNSGNSGSNGTLLWEQMLEMQGGADSLKKENSKH